MVSADSNDVEQLIKKLATEMYREPLRCVIEEKDYPNPSNPLHVAYLLLDFHTELEMEGMLTYIENTGGRHLAVITEALDRIGLPDAVRLLRAVQDCMVKHGVTSDLLLADLATLEVGQTTSFHQRHGEALTSFADEIGVVASGFYLFAEEKAYSAFSAYMQERSALLAEEMAKRTD